MVIVRDLLTNLVCVRRDRYLPEFFASFLHKGIARPVRVILRGPQSLPLAIRLTSDRASAVRLLLTSATWATDAGQRAHCLSLADDC